MVPSPILKAKSLPTWIVVTGNVRSGREFQGMFRKALDLQKRGLADGILFATWKEELSLHPGLQRALAGLGICVVAIDPPPRIPQIHPLFHSYVFHQRKSLLAALRALPENCLVLKTRTDLSEERFDALTQALFAEPRPSLDVTLCSPVLQTRLFTFDARTDYLFYWDDIVFSGLRDDLLHLVNFEVSFEVLYSSHIFSAEMRLYAPIFLQHYPILAWFFESIPGEQFGCVLQRWAADANQPALPELARSILSAYFHILSRYVILPAPIPAPGQPLQLRDFFTDNAARGLRSFPTPWPSHKLHTQSLLDQLRRGENLAGEEIVSLHAKLEEMDRDVQTRENMPQDMDRATAELVAFAKSYGISLSPVTNDYYEGKPIETAISLETLPLPEKRFPPWWEQKTLGARKKAAHWMLEKIL